MFTSQKFHISNLNQTWELKQLILKHRLVSRLRRLDDKHAVNLFLFRRLLLLCDKFKEHKLTRPVAFLYLCTDLSISSPTLNVPSPHGTITLIAPKQTVTFMMAIIPSRKKIILKYFKRSVSLKFDHSLPPHYNVWFIIALPLHLKILELKKRIWLSIIQMSGKESLFSIRSLCNATRAVLFRLGSVNTVNSSLAAEFIEMLTRSRSRL